MSARVFIDGVFLCNIPDYRVSGMLERMTGLGLNNVTIKWS